jgi:hypothetical protein
MTRKSRRRAKQTAMCNEQPKSFDSKNKERGLQPTKYFSPSSITAKRIVHQWLAPLESALRLDACPRQNRWRSVLISASPHQNASQGKRLKEFKSQKFWPRCHQAGQSRRAPHWLQRFHRSIEKCSFEVLRFPPPTALYLPHPALGKSDSWSNCLG